MYIPKHFEMSDKRTIIDFIARNRFGILVSTKNGALEATHLPLLYDERSDRLFGHFAKANEQWKGLHGAEVLVIFQGPHAYISPTWYGEKHAVPTWNYVAVHIYGQIGIIEDREKIRDILDRSVDKIEASMPHPWKVDWSDEFYWKLADGVVGFEVKPFRMEGKWKLNQNHSIERRKKVIDGLRAQGDPMSASVADWMEQHI